MMKMGLTAAVLPLLLAAAAGAEPKLSAAVDKSSGVYTVSVDWKAWYSSPGPATVCIGGKQTQLKLTGTKASSGSDKFGAWTGTTASYSAGGGGR